MFRSGFPFQIWFLILSGLRLNPVLTLSYPFISLLFSFGCASTFFTSIALLKLDCEDLMYDSAQSLFFSPPFFIPSSQGGYGVLRCYSIAILQSTSRIRASFIGCIPFTADSPGVAVSPWCSISSGPVLSVLPSWSGWLQLLWGTLPVVTDLYPHPCPTCFRSLFLLFHYCFWPKSASFSDAKIVCSRERPVASANGVSAKIFLYQAGGLP